MTSVTRPDFRADPAGFLALMRERYERGVDAERENRDQAHEDLKFRAGDQYTDEEKSARTGRPLLTINRTGQFVRQVTGDMRLNMPQIVVKPVGEGADEATADIFTGLIRNIQQISRARHAYLTAADNQTTCGEGAFKITTEFSTEDGFDLDIRIRRITDVFSVVWDPQADEMDKSDAQYCFLTSTMGFEEFRAKYPDAAPADFKEFNRQLGETARHGLWQTGKDVVIAEYWVKVPGTRELALLDDGTVVDLNDPSKADFVVAIKAGELKPKSRRSVATHRVLQYIVSGAAVLEGPFEWPTGDIPIIPVVGEEVHIGRRVIRNGLVRYLRDPQKAFNLMRSASVESVAMQPKAPFYATAKQIQGHEANWIKVANENYPVLIYNADPDAPGPPGRIAPPAASSGLVQEIGLAAEDMKAVTGIFDASLGARSNETSAVAIRARQQEGDVGTFVYIDNLTMALETAGRQLVRLIPKVYDTERYVRLLMEDGEERTVVLNKFDEATGRIENDISVGKYDVVVQTGPSFSTRRQEAASSMQETIRAFPRIIEIAGDLLFRNLDWPGADEIAKRLKRSIPRHLTLDDEALRALAEQPRPPTAEEVELQIKARQAAAKAEKAQADAAKTRTETAQLSLELAAQNGELQALMDQVAAMAARQAALTLIRQISAAQPLPGEETVPGTEAVSSAS